jgi:hypothetical protein
MLAVGRGSVTRGSIEIARRVITGLGLSVTQPGRDVPILRGQASLPTAHPGQLVCPGVLAVPGGLGAVFGRHLAVIYGLGAIIGSLGVPRWRTGTFALGLLTLTCRAVSCRPVEIARRVIARRGLSVTLLGLPVTHVGGQIAVAPFYVALTCDCQGVFIGQSTQAWAGGHNNCSNRMAVVDRSRERP